jgi:outer membrane protein insertion porin family
MTRFNIKFLLFIILVTIIICTKSVASVIKKFEINGNQRISDSTIIMFSTVSVLDEVNSDSINDILKSLYETNYFKDVSVSLDSGKLVIYVEENPIIENIEYNGIKSKTLKNNILKDVKLKSRSSYNKFLLDEDKRLMLSALKNYGYYQPIIDIFVEELTDNKVDIKFDIDIGDKAKIKKITFLGNKTFKDSKLKNVIVSEEYKFWKFISGKKYLNENLVNLDIRLLNNFYRNKGFYNVEINSSFAKLLSSNEFELIYNINANQVTYFGQINLELPVDYNRDNFSELIDIFNETKGEKYSFSLVEKILDKIDLISINEQYQSIKATVEENVEGDIINLTFKIEETEKVYVNKINIFGNNVTEESVIRNQFEIDEGDPYNDILMTRSINNLKQLGFFRSVDHKIVDENDTDKTVNIYVVEKPTGEISAGAGFGTSGGTIFFNVRENNYLGKGILLDSQLQVSAEAIKGSFKTTNNNYKNTNKSVSFGLEADENDRLKDFGYKSNKTGFSVGTKFEYLDDLRLGVGTSTYYERIETDNTASTRQKKQEGDYWDTFLDVDLSYDKRNQRYKATQGYTSYYSLNLPLISTNYSLTSAYNYKVYTELFDNNISSFSFSLKGASSLTGKDIKLSERLYVPSSKLRGFEQGKVGPKDGNDFIGGNFVTSMNLTSTLPQVLSNLQTVDFLVFLDAANIWGVDYDSSIDKSSKIRSSIGVGVDWFTPVGPLNFSLAQDLTSHKNDITETFRFNLGTTF